MKKCFPCFFCYKKKKKIDEPVETKKIVPDGPKEPEVRIQQQDAGKRRPIIIQKASKPLNDGASSSNWTIVSQKKGYLEQAKDVGAGAAAAAGQAKDMAAAAAQQAKDIGVGAAEQARTIGKAAFNLLPNNIKGKFEKKNDRKEFRRVILNAKEEEMKQNKIRRQEKEEEKRRQQDLAEKEKKQKKIRQEKEDEKRKKQAPENNTGGASVVTVITGSLWTAMSSLTNASTQTPGTAQPSTSQTGRPSTSTQYPFSTQKKTQPVEKKGKKDR